MENAKKSGIMKSGVDAMPLFLPDDLLKRSMYLGWMFNFENPSLLDWGVVAFVLGNYFQDFM